MRQQRLQLGAKDKGAIRQQRVIQRLDGKPVARQKKRFAVAIPEGKGEHATKALNAIFAPGFPGVHDDFGIAAGMKNVAKRLQLGDQLLVIVDFAVEHHANALILVVQRLLAGRQVDDRQPAMAQAETGLDV